MHGVIAAGSAPTADAGAKILRNGGNAADAVVAACFATSAGEPTLTSLAGAGIMLYRCGDSGETTICDFFSDAPHLGPEDVDGLDFYGVDLDFGPVTQRFHIAAGSSSVPGVIPGLCRILERWGTMPLTEVVKPACEALRYGVKLGPYQGTAAKLLEPILTSTDSCRAVFHVDGRMVGAGDTFKIPQLADTLEAMAAQGWQRHYEEVLCTAMLEQFGPKAGGMLTPEDFSAYEIQFREPLSLRYRRGSVHVPSPPAAGGPMIAMMLRLLDTVSLSELTPGSNEHTRALSSAMTVADEARTEGMDGLDDERFAHWLARYRELASQPFLTSAAGGGGPGSTTHVSVIDADGNAAAVTFSFGEGNAHIIGNTGIVMNNLMGEEDLFPQGFGSAPKGLRLPTMMSPTVLIGDDGSVTVLGTGGANRIRTSIVQVISLLTDHGYPPQAAVSAPRVHFEDGVLNAEVFELADSGDALEELRPKKLIRFPERNLFFGGVHMVQRTGDGTLRGAGDPRRGGVCRVV